MKACLAAWLWCVILCKLVCNGALVNVTPAFATDQLPVLNTSVILRRPYCYFNNSCSNCEVWLVSSLASVTNAYDQHSQTDFHAPYPGAYTSTGKNFSTLFIDQLHKIPCPAVSPFNIKVGDQSDLCLNNYCNGLLPEGQTMSFKYILTQGQKVVDETKWSKNVTLKSLKDLQVLGANGYAGRSGAMVVITTILSVLAALLLLLLLTALIVACCCRQKTTKSYETRQQPSVIGSLRIPSYDVHHLRNPSPYDNPVYEQNLKKRYTTNTTLPQTTTTVITHVQSVSTDNVIVQNM